jgi:hypothetical protein
VELIWKHYRDDEKVVAALERMAREKSSLGTKVIPYWPGLEKYARLYRWGTPPETWKMFHKRTEKVEEKEEEENELDNPIRNATR